MPTVSIITAAFAPAAEHLAETEASVSRQALPSDWEIEWVVQEDGDTPALANQFSGLDYVRYDSNGLRLGIAATRNLALSRATGDLIQVLDSDDVLLPGALGSMVPLFDDERIHWAVGQADDLMPDGTRVPWESALPYGTVEAGAVNTWAESHGGNWPIHCAGLMLRSASLRALGGWVGLPGDEDIAMFAALSELSDGHNFCGVTWLYRQHDQQVTRSKKTLHLSAACRRFALQRAKAVRLTQLGFTQGGQSGFGYYTHDVQVGPAAKQPRRIEA